MSVLKMIDNDIIKNSQRLHIENEVLRAGFLSAKREVIEELQEKFKYDSDLKDYFSEEGESLKDFFKKNEARLGGRWAKEDKDRKAKEDLKNRYRPFFDPKSRFYSAVSGEDNWKKRLELYRLDRDTAEELASEYK